MGGALMHGADACIRSERADRPGAVRALCGSLLSPRRCGCEKIGEASDLLGSCYQLLRETGCDPQQQWQPTNGAGQYVRTATANAVQCGPDYVVRRQLGAAPMADRGRIDQRRRNLRHADPALPQDWGSGGYRHLRV